MPGPAAAEALVVYPARNEQPVKRIFDAHTKQTGVQIRFTTGDAGELWNAAQRDVTTAGAT